MTLSLLAGLCGIALSISIAAVIRTWHLQNQLDKTQQELDHTHGLAHGLAAALIAHIEGADIGIHPIHLRDTDKE